MPTSLATVLSIAGTDPSGGAGIQADIKAISATGAYAATVITSLVAQNTQGVQAIESVALAFIRKQLQVVFGDLSIDAVKIGMLQNAEVIAAVADELQSLRIPHLVLDPVMLAKDGSALLDLEAIHCLKKRLIARATLITPNLPEAEYLSNRPINHRADMEMVARQIAEESQVNVLLKGGHLEGKLSQDLLYVVADGRCHWFDAVRIHTKNTHGTGCSLSSAIASYLAQGFPLVEAVRKAKTYIHQAILSGAGYAIGHGSGPIDHFFFLENRAKNLIPDSLDPKGSSATD
jgi:hydroxymethylpyrimidine/phosphomethylpyrimidine kinase